MDVAEFYQWVRDTLNRGTTLDNVIPHYIRAAVREIENKRDWSKLEWWATFSLSPSDDPIISAPSELKRIRFIRYDDKDDGETRPEWEYLHQADPEHIISRVSDSPKLYWLMGRQHIVLDAKLDEKTRDFEISAFRYSDFADESSGSGVSHWLVDAIPMGLHAKTMLGLAGYMREDDPRMIQNWQNLYAEAIRDLTLDDEWLKEGGSAAEMTYWPEHIPRANAYEDTE